MSERIKSLQAGIKIAMPGGMPNRKASNIQIERQVEKEAGETSAPVSAYTAKGRLRSIKIKIVRCQKIAVYLQFVETKNSIIFPYAQ